MGGAVAANIRELGPVRQAGKERGDEGYVVVGLCTMQNAVNTLLFPLVCVITNVQSAFVWVIVNAATL